MRLSLIKKNGCCGGLRGKNSAHQSSESCEAYAWSFAHLNPFHNCAPHLGTKHFCRLNTRSLQLPRRVAASRNSLFPWSVFSPPNGRLVSFSHLFVGVGGPTTRAGRVERGESVGQQQTAACVGECGERDRAHRCLQPKTGGQRRVLPNHRKDMRFSV